MPHLLIAHAALGTGHKSAAEALEAAIKRMDGVTAQVKDALDFANPLVRAGLPELYRRASEDIPLLYKLLYEAGDTDDLRESVAGNRLLARLERPLLGDLDDYVERMKPDAIVCAHPLPAHGLQHARHRGRLPQPFYMVVTDFMAHGAWLAPGAAGYFVPSEVTRDNLIARGVPAERLHVTGIPVRLEIGETKERAAMRERHDLPADGPLITLFGGGIAPEHVRQIVSDLTAGPIEGTLVVIAGRNEALADAIDDLRDGQHMRLRTLGLIDYVDDLVTASDLVITKAGGLIVSEVLARGRPMVIVEPLPGQEEWNADFVAAVGAGVQLRMPEMVAPTVKAILDDPDRLAWMAAQARRYGHPDAAEAIVKIILDDLARGKPPA